MKDSFDSPAFKTIRNLEKTSIMRTIRKINEMPAMKIIRQSFFIVFQDLQTYSDCR